MRETELYAPVKRFLEAEGYEVKAEVEDCDVVGLRGGQMVVVELKRRFNLDLVLQGVERQRLTDLVYLAVEAPRGRRTARWYEVQRLCRRLGLGLLSVGSRDGSSTVEVVCAPEVSAPRQTRRGRARLVAEFNGRSGDHNTGGSTRQPIVTAYREAALRIAHFLGLAGPASTERIRAGTGVGRAASILQRDAYRWFRRVERGVYELTPGGEEGLAAYSGVVAGWPAAEPEPEARILE